MDTNDTEYYPKNAVDREELKIYRLSGDKKKYQDNTPDRKPTDKPAKAKAWDGTRRD